MSINPQQQRDEACVQLLAHFFQRFRVAENIAPEAAGHVLPVYFLGWLDTQLSLCDPVTECEAAGVTFADWEYLREHIVGNAAGVERITPIWPSVTIADRPMPVHKLKGFTWNMILEWEDGRMIPIQVHVSNEMLEGPGFHDSTVAQILASRAKVFADAVIDQGLDGLHEQAGSYGGDQPFNVLMGMILQMLNGSFVQVVDGQPVQIKPELVPYIKDYMRLCQAVIQPPIPPEVRAALAKKKAELGKPGVVTGGWDG